MVGPFLETGLCCHHTLKKLIAMKTSHKQQSGVGLDSGLDEQQNCDGTASAFLLGSLSDFLRTLDFNSPNNIGLLCDFCLELVQGKFVVYNRFSLEKEQIDTCYRSGLPVDFRTRGRLRGRICYEEFVHANKTKSCLPDLTQSLYWQSDPDLKRYGLKAYVGAAVTVGGCPRGSLAVYHNLPGVFTLEHAKALEVLAIVLSVIDDRQRAVEDLKQKTSHEKMIADISDRAITDQEIEPFLDHCLSTIGQSLKVDAVSVYWNESYKSKYRKITTWQRSDGHGQINDSDMEALLHLPFISQAIATGFYCCEEVAALADVAAKELLQRQNIKSLLILPLANFEKPSGVCLIEMRKEVRRWRIEDLTILRTVMQIIGKWMESNTIACKLNESEALHSQLVKLSPMAIYRIDLVNQRFLQVNEHMCQAMGYTEEEFLALRPEELLTNESRKLYKDRLMAMAAGRPVSDNVEFQLVTKSGDLEWGHFHIRHFYEGGRITGATVIAHFVTERKKVQDQLDSYHRKLEILVEERTSELSEANRQLQKEAERHANTAKELLLNSERLKELNTAMRVLLDKAKEERERIEENIRVNLKELIEPYLNRLEISGLSKSQHQLIDLIRMNLDEVFGSSMPEFASSFLFFTPNELQVVNLIRKGKTTKEIAYLLNISARTVEAYRNSIRKKLGLKNKKVNLRTYLFSKK
jgi:PAS domain S-box-containing protein